MSEHRAVVRWEHTRGDFANGTYSREHEWSFDGGLTVPASPSPSAVRVPYSNPSYVDPEEAYVASIASCHLLTFLWLASKQKLEVERYEDEAVGYITKNERGVPWVSSVVLSPNITYREGKAPTADQERTLHEQAHEECFIANSVKTEIRVEARSALSNERA
jgi:organic hydroperoxide reductase OsmC/OhrA